MARKGTQRTWRVAEKRRLAAGERPRHFLVGRKGRPRFVYVVVDERSGERREVSGPGGHERGDRLPSPRIWERLD